MDEHGIVTPCEFYHFLLETSAPVPYVNCDIFFLILLFIVFSIFLLFHLCRRAIAAVSSVYSSVVVAVMMRLPMITRNSIDSTAMIRKETIALDRFGRNVFDVNNRL